MRIYIYIYILEKIWRSSRFSMVILEWFDWSKKHEVAPHIIPVPVGLLGESSQSKSKSSQLRHASVEKRPNAQCFLYGKKMPLYKPKAQTEASFDGASFLREYAGQIWGINAKGFLALFFAHFAAMLLFMGREKNNGGHCFKSHKKPCYNQRK